MNTFNTNPEEYDLVVLGSGAGGKLIAWTLLKPVFNTSKT